MLCPICLNTAHRFGRDRNGNQRFQCLACRRTFTDPNRPPEDRRRLPADRAVYCLCMLLEGVSVRSTERLTRVHRDTILRTMVEAGERCQRFLDHAIQGAPVDDVQADEVWAFIGCKEKTRERQNYAEWFGDAYCFTALERDTKLILTWHLGKRRRPTPTCSRRSWLARRAAGSS